MENTSNVVNSQISKISSKNTTYLLEEQFSKKIQTQISLTCFEYLNKIMKSNNPREIKPEETIFFGDSLTVGMNHSNNLVSQGYTVEAKVSRFIQGAIEVAKNHNNFKNIIITIGTNNYSANDEIFKDEYLKLITIIKNNNPNSNIYLNSIPPCNENNTINHGYNITNFDIDNKNQIIYELAIEQNCYFINSNEYLKETGYSSGDGVHLSPDTYVKLFEYIKDFISRQYL